MITVRKSNAYINFGSGGSFALYGDDDAVQIGDNATLYAFGRALHIYAGGVNDVLTVGGNGVGASDADDIFVQIQNAGVVRELTNSRVEVTANVSRITMSGDDALGVYGFGDTVIANGANDAIWIGQNGQHAASYALDRVTGLKGGSVHELQGSSVVVSGSAYLATMSGDDTLTALGQGVSVEATGAGNVLTIGAGLGYHSLNSVQMDGGVIYQRAGTDLSVTGDNITLYGAGVDSLILKGAGDRAVYSGMGNGPFVIGQAGSANQALDTLIFPYEPLVHQVAVYADSNVKIVGANANVTLGGHDRVTVYGLSEAIVDQTGGNAITIGGNGSFFNLNGQSQITLAPGDTVAMLDNSNLFAHAPATFTNGQYAVHMAANDALSVDNGMTVYVPVAAGSDFIAGFRETDVLRLATHFADVADLFAHTSINGSGQTVIALDAVGDALTLSNSFSAFSGFVAAGLVKFS